MNNGIINALPREGLSLQRMLMLSSDGPNVNISLKKMLNLAVKECGGKSLVEIGSCNLHSKCGEWRSDTIAFLHLTIEPDLTVKVQRPQSVVTLSNVRQVAHALSPLLPYSNYGSN